ncbi:MAG: hypothetical protein Q4C13_07525 [Clostridia bacterium]|nr:hypothetical protein [Clostridia bacterium]
MAYIQRINRRLDRAFHGAVRAREERGCLVLSGALPAWDEVVRAGRMALNKRRYIGLVNDIVCTGESDAPMRMPAQGRMC